MTTRNFFAALLSAVFAIGVANTADAQLFGKKNKHKQETTAEEEPQESKKERKRRRKEERKREKEEKKKERKHKSKKEKTSSKKEGKKTSRKHNSPARTHDVNYPSTQKKDRYRIDLLASLYVDELVTGNSANYKDKLPEKAIPGVAFYQGVKLAADSLNAAGYSIDVYVHDITSSSETPEQLILNRKLDSSDLVLGAVQSRDIAMLAGYAKRKHINFVSALSPANSNVKDNPYFTLLQPSLKTHCEWISSDLTKKFPNQKIALLYRTTVQADDNAWKYFINEIEGEADVNELQCNALPTKEQMLSVFDTSKPNVVVVPVLDIDYADSLLRALAIYFPNTHFEVYGMPTWTNLEGMRKPQAYRNLTINISHPFNFDQTAASVQQVEQRYKRQYSGTPSEFVYRGYETMMWYAGLLNKYGTIFNEKYSDLSGAPLTKFNIVPVWDKRGYILYYENTHIYLTTYEAGMSKTVE